MVFGIKLGEIMKIEHIAIWTEDLEKMKTFYVDSFDAKPGAIYRNEVKGFYSYFLSFEGSGVRIELMTRSSALTGETHRGFSLGLAHLAMCVSNRDEVNLMTERLRKKGVRVVSEPRHTGDGYYESAVLDLEGNYIEICSLDLQ